MYLKELTINGFKSFAKKGELEFSTPITAIVGPNGSGKSNVAEAFRFVLGEQSIKSMRGKKGEDLIFNGSESSARSNRASVSITLLNKERDGERVFPLDFEEIIVERVVHRDGTNEYSINGSKTRLKDVQELLASGNIGSTGHHIISQGESDRILTANPRERREMIEDALGLKVFQYKKAESERKLKRTEENIAHVELLRKEVQPHLKFLERQVKKIEKSLKLQENLKTIYAEYLKREDSYVAFHFDRLTEARREPEEKQKELRRALLEAKEKLSKDTDPGKRSAIVALDSDIADLRSKRQEAIRAHGTLEGQIDFLIRRIDEYTKRNESDTESPIPYDEFKRATTEVEKTIERAKEANDVAIIKRALHDILGVLQTLLHRAINTNTEAGIEREERELKELKKEKSEADSVLHRITEEEKNLADEYSELKQSIEAEAGESREAEREVFAIMNGEREIDQVLGNIDRDITTLERDRAEFKRELQEAVSLLGRGASEYFEYSIVSEDGIALSREEIVNEDRDVQLDRRRELEKMKIRLEELGSGANEDVLKEYTDVKERDEFLVHEIADLEASVIKLEELIADLTEELNKQFLSGIEKIGTEFGKFFVLMFGGGAAELKRVKPKVRKKKVDDGLVGIEDEVEQREEEEEESEEGIEIDVKLPNKRIRGLDMLSGGERALTSIALIFAMSQVNPPLFVILDETDAALDEANSRRYGDMIGALAERSQLILITHNRETMSRAGVLYGITMGADGISKLLSVKFDEAVTVAK